MHAHPFSPTQGRPAARGWACVGVWWLALGIALQGTVIASERTAEPAHVHTPATAERQRDAMLDGVRVVQNHHASARHHHAEVEHHAHDAAAGDVIYVDDDPAHPDAAKTGGKRLAADLDTPTLTLPVAPAALPLDCGDPDPACTYRSHVGGRLERPPR